MTVTFGDTMIQDELDFFIDTTSGSLQLSELDSLEGDGECLICCTYGRGKASADLQIPRMPKIQCQAVVNNDHVQVPRLPNQTFLDDNSRPEPKKVGRGRARLLKLRHEKLEREKLSLGALPNGLIRPGTDIHVQKPDPCPTTANSLSSSASSVSYTCSSLVSNTDLADSQDRISSTAKFSLEDFPALESSKRNGNQTKSSLENKLSFNSLSNIMIKGCDENTNKSSKLETSLSIKDSVSKLDSSVNLLECVSKVDSSVNTPESDIDETLVFGDDIDIEFDNLKGKQEISPTCMNTTSQASGQSFTNDSASIKWTLSGENVVQCDGLPLKCNLSTIEDVVASFGKIIQKERQVGQNSSSVRFKLGSSEACDWAVSCLHDSDCVYPDANRIMVCFRVDS